MRHATKKKKKKEKKGEKRGERIGLRWEWNPRSRAHWRIKWKWFLHLQLFLA
jgi:hypothetical protein